MDGAMMNVREEVEKARGGEKSKVRLLPVPKSAQARELELEQRGYEFVFGTGFKDREALINSLPPLKWPQVEK
jgi:hypothetical protein